MKSSNPTYLLAFSMLSQMVALVGFIGCQLWIHTNPFGIYVNLLISLGGMIFGLVAAAGIYPGAKLSGVAPGWGFGAIIALVTGLNVLLYHYALFWIASRGVDGIGFTEFMDSTAGHARMTFGHSDDPSEIGKAGYGLVFLDIAWAAGFSFWPISLLRRQAHCHNCGVYFATRAKREIRFFDTHSLAEVMQLLPGPSAERAEMVMNLSQDPNAKPCVGSIQLTARLGQCPSCQEQDMTETLSVHNGKGYVTGETFSYRWRKAASRNAPPMVSPDPAARQPIAAPQRQGFGRKGLG
ncbi:MAG: hypothetical protein ABL881_12030 [Novosphingobium sp.]